VSPTQTKSTDRKKNK